MKENVYKTPLGEIHYWTEHPQPGAPTLVFLPGLTADHRLFEKQLPAFAGHNLFTWDAPGHGLSRPFRLEFSLMDKARWLHAILAQEGMTRPVLIGQSMGGYVSQAFLEAFPGEAAGFISIDSAPLQRAYTSWWEIWLLRRIEPLYQVYPWESLKKAAITGVSTTEYGRKLMAEIIASYERREYCHLAGHGYRLLGDAMKARLPYLPRCPVMLLCGEKDMAGSAKAYNRRWAKKTGYPFHLIPGAGHNSNTDRPEEVNALIADFVNKLEYH